MICNYLLVENPAAARVCGILLAALLPLFTASLTLFLDFCYQPGEVFARWGLLLRFWWIKSRYPVFRFGQSKRRPQKWWAQLLKPMGLCPFCHGVYVCAFFWVAIIQFLLFGDWLLTLILLPLVVGNQYVLLKKLMKSTK